MSYILGALALTNVGTAIWLAMIALRNGGLKKELADSDSALEKSEANVIGLSEELNTTVEKGKRRMAALRTEIKSLEADIEKYSRPGDRKRRIERLFAKAGDDA